MAARDPIRIRYNPSRTYVNTQNNYVGAQDTAGRRGTLPTFTDLNTRYVAKTGSDSGAGTSADPYLTIQHGLNNIAGAFLYVVVQDSGIYRENLSIAIAGGSPSGLYAADGETPTVSPIHGASPGTFGARATGRIQFSGGAYPSTFYFVSKAGNT